MLMKTIFGRLPATRPLTVIPQFSFTRAVKKIVLTQDVDNLGFTGEICFVKPGHALNNLVP